MLTRLKWYQSSSVEQILLVRIELKSPYLLMYSSPAQLEEQVKETFSVAQDMECRVWHRYMTNTYELLSNSSQTLQDAGLYNGQVSYCWLLKTGFMYCTGHSFGAEERGWQLA